MRRIFKLTVIGISLMSLNMSAPTPSGRTQCPTITIECATELIEPNKPFKVTVNVDGADPKLSLSYNWSTSAGTIVSGQGTPAIIIQNPLPHCQTTTATVEVAGLDSSCQRTASCTTTIYGIPVSRKFDEYEAIGFKDEKARLEKFAAQLRTEPGSTGYIVFHQGRRANAGQAVRRAERAKIYLVNTVEIDSARILTVDGGERDAMMIELWIAPQGAPAPPDFVSTLPKCPQYQGY